METKTEVTRFIRMVDVQTPPETLKRAAEECDAYTFQKAGEGCVVCIHEGKAYPIIKHGDKIGCGCADWTLRCRDSEGCKHVKTLMMRQRDPSAALDREVARDLIAAGWISDEGGLRPPGMTSDEDGEECDGGDPAPGDVPKREPVAPPGIPEETKMSEENTQTAIQTAEPQRGFLTAAVSLDDAIAAFDLYEQAKTRLLGDSDILYYGENGKPVHKDVEGSTPYIRKSGWRKMARFFGLSVDILGKDKIWTEDAQGEAYYIWTYQIRVSHTCGAYVNAEGVCSSRDKFFTKGGKVTADEKNVMLKAQTVGINRGISDLLGAGEVSAEELE